MGQSCSSRSLPALDRDNVRWVEASVPVALIARPNRQRDGIQRVSHRYLCLDALTHIVRPVVHGQNQCVPGLSAAMQRQSLEGFCARLLLQRADRQPNSRNAGDGGNHRADRGHEFGRQPTRYLHFSSPALSNSRTVEATGGGVIPPPSAPAGASRLTERPDD